MKDITQVLKQLDKDILAFIQPVRDFAGQFSCCLCHLLFRYLVMDRLEKLMAGNDDERRCVRLQSHAELFEILVPKTCIAMGGGSADAEITALRTTYPEDYGNIQITNTKGYTGHTLGAAGGIEAVLTLRALQEGRTFGTPSCQEIDPTLAVQPLAQHKKTNLSGKIGISHSLAFGGGNAALVMETAP